MPVSFLNEAERDRLNRFPGQISDKDLVVFFALSASGGSVGIRVKSSHMSPKAYATHGRSCQCPRPEKERRKVEFVNGLMSVRERSTGTLRSIEAGN